MNSRDSYLHLAGRIMAANIPCLKFLMDVSEASIPHHYSKELKNVSETVRIVYVLL